MAEIVAPLYRSAFVPHDLAAPLEGASQGPLAGLTAAIKDMYDVEGYVAGSGNPTWLETHAPRRGRPAACSACSMPAPR